MGAAHLLLFPGVFQKCAEALCGEPGFSCKDIRDSLFLPEAEKYLAAAQSLSYLYMPVMQAEDPHPERERKDRGALPEVRHYVYQKELMQGNLPVTRL